MRKFIRATILLLSTFGVCSCGSDDGIFGDYRVDDIRLIANDIEIGEDARADIFFETRVEADGRPDGLELVIRLSPSLDYLDGSAEIYDDSLSDSDDLDPDSVIRCESGETYIVFRLSGSDLRDRSVSSVSDFALRINVVGKSANSAARIEAAADESQDFACGAEFDSEESDSIEVLG